MTKVLYRSYIVAMLWFFPALVSAQALPPTTPAIGPAVGSEKTLELTKCQTSSENCDFYRQLMRTQCCPKGYNEKVGLPYCERFLAEEKDFSPSGKLFLQKTRKCLQEQAALVPSATPCRSYNKAALDSHSTCYLQSGVCTLPWKDLGLLLRGIGPRALSPSFMRESLETGLGCADEYWAAGKFSHLPKPPKDFP